MYHVIFYRQFFSGLDYHNLFSSYVSQILIRL